jgi:hypothetical protein
MGAATSAARSIASGFIFVSSVLERCVRLFRGWPERGGRGSAHV